MFQSLTSSNKEIIQILSPLIKPSILAGTSLCQGLVRVHIFPNGICAFRFTSDSVKPTSTSHIHIEMLQGKATQAIRCQLNTE